ncbi:lamin tail domain-containing protein, partial [Candidatus Poribacteria bacterium]|nr:lamin tail domain-containing protein [Candidatus Poribacteria bacterium]
AGNYFWEMSPDGTEIYPYSYRPDSTQTTAPLTEVGAWQRRRLEQPGYLAAAWTSVGYQAHIGYDRRAPAALCLGTPGYVRDPSRSQLVPHRLVFNEIRNASDDTNDWIELKNVCGTDVQLSDWEISIVLNVDQDVDIVSFPDYTLPMDGVLLITNTDPSKTVIADGLNIATRARQSGAQRPYLVAHGLRLPSTPYLLILRHVGEYGERTIADMAGNYPFTASHDGTEIYLLANAPQPPEPLAPLTQLGAWQRRHLKQPGYLAAAWMSSGYHAHIGYDRHAPASLCLGTPGYRYDPSPSQLVTRCLAFNKIHNASDNAANHVDWIELKNVYDMDVRLRDWEISIITSEGEAADQDVGIVSFPDYTLPVGGVLLIINADPGETGIADGLNISTETQQKRTQCPYLVARDLKLPETPYLLILRHARSKNGTPEAIEDVAGDYFRYDDDTEVWPLAYTRRPSAPAAPLSEAGTYQRKDARQPGYLATAWTTIHPQNYGYDPDAFAALPVTRRLAFNKIHNAANHTNDWIELKNISDTEVRLRDWDISMVASEGEAADQDVSIVSFPDYTLPVGGMLLITNTDPDETVIIDGLNITPDTTGERQQTGAQHPYLVAHDLSLPSAPYLLILRHARSKNGTPEAIEDVAGDYFRYDDDTEVWPLAYTRRPSAPAAPLSEAGTYQRKDARQPGYLATAWTVNQSPPGLSDTPNTLEGGANALFASDANAAAVIFNPTLPDEVRISELMSETQGPSDALPQWIELYNASPTPMDLEGWQLVIETRTAERHRHAQLTLKTFSLPPKQTVILVSEQGKRSRRLPIDRVYDLSKAHADVFSRYLKNTIIGTEGFCVELIHPTGRVVDSCGNLDGDKDTDDLPTWTLPDHKTPQGHRSSLLRRFDADVHKGTEASAWMPATETAIGVNTYYGHPTDISTPGFLHQIVPGTSPMSTLSISEIMFETQIRTRPLPQWIELYNPSFTHSVKLKDYQLLVETLQAGKHQQILITLEAFDVLPNQTALLITEQEKHSWHLTDHLIYNLSQRHPKAFLYLSSRSRLLSSDGFLIQLTDDSGNVVDTIGNLDGYPSTKDTPAWALPPGETSDGERASLRRLYEKQIPLDGRYAEAWVSTADVPPKIITYYGHASDLGNPGYRKGTPLPVTLSSFRAAWRTDTVQITWTTESELDNAGFNILRSQTKEGEFQQINTKLIQGAGTTSERNEYTWTDTTAKPNTLYYYRIEDVSYAGKRKQLATVRIRGLVSPNGKLITRWGDVKNQQ